MSTRLHTVRRSAFRVLVASTLGAALVCGAAPLLGATLVPQSGLVTPSDADERVDPIARLQLQMNSGAVSLQHDSALGYLPGLLAALDIPISSQTLVFSRTSLQTDGIAPWAPRALYFNDDVYVGYVQESTFIEIAAVHPTEGGVFYTLPQAQVDLPTFQRESTTCLMCHDSRSVTGGVPGFIMRSVLTDRLGYVVTDVHSGLTTDRTPLDRRWGGWYVTGSHGSAPHAGNTAAPELKHEVPNVGRYLDQFDLGSTGNLTELRQFFDPEPYLSPHSDIVALMVLTHQVRIHNLIALTHVATAEALSAEEARVLSRGEADSEAARQTTRARIESAADRLIREMLFVRAAPLEAPVTGTSTFAQEFEQLGPVDSRGRSLRELDLGDQLFRYPLSFLIYSDAFQALPDLTRTVVYERLASILAGADSSDDFAHLSGPVRAALREILSETLPELRPHLESAAGSPSS